MFNSRNTGSRCTSYGQVPVKIFF